MSLPLLFWVSNDRRLSIAAAAAANTTATCGHADGMAFCLQITSRLASALLQGMPRR